MKLLGWFIVGCILWATPAAAEMWQYTDESGQLNFTNEFNNIPPKLRGSAQKHTLKTNDEIVGERRARLEALSPEQAKAALQAGELTEDEVRMLVTKGSLRTSEIGDAFRFAVSANKLAERQRAAAQAATAASQGAFDGLSADQLKAASGVQVGMLKGFLQSIRASHNFRNSLIFEGILFLGLIIGLPFTLRNYRDDGTRRIIRASFFFSFLIISATGNMLFFKQEISKAFALEEQLHVPTASAPTSNPSTGAPAGQPAHLVAP